MHLQFVHCVILSLLPEEQVIMNLICFSTLFTSTNTCWCSFHFLLKILLHFHAFVLSCCIAQTQHPHLSCRRKKNKKKNYLGCNLIRQLMWMGFDKFKIVLWQELWLYVRPVLIMTSQRLQLGFCQMLLYLPLILTGYLFFHCPLSLLFGCFSLDIHKQGCSSSSIAILML